MFSGRGFPIRIFKVFGRNQKEPRRKVTQIRGGITSRSALFDLIVAISDFRFPVIFHGSSVFPVPGIPKKGTLIISVNRMYYRVSARSYQFCQRLSSNKCQAAAGGNVVTDIRPFGNAE